MLKQSEREARLDLAREILEQGGNLSTFADRLGVKLPAASKWLSVHGLELRQKLAYAEPNRSHRALVRLLLIRVAMEFKGGQARLSRALYVKRQRSINSLIMFKRRWARDSVDAAILDLWPDDEPPAFRPIIPAGNHRSSH
jgi:transposase-like protein